MTVRTTRDIDADPVLLRGGPMDGWYVKVGAAVFDPDWFEGYVLHLATFNMTTDWAPGRYGSAEPDQDGTKTAEWRPAG